MAKSKTKDPGAGGDAAAADEAKALGPIEGEGEGCDVPKALTRKRGVGETGLRPIRRIA